MKYEKKFKMSVSSSAFILILTDVFRSYIFFKEHCVFLLVIFLSLLYSSRLIIVALKLSL